MPAADPPGSRPRPRGTALAVAFMLLSVVGIVAYWGVWFFGDRTLLANGTSPTYFAYENAFPLADTWMGLTSLLGAVTLVRRRPSAVLWILLACSAGIYLGLMDVLFNLENHIYAGERGASLMFELFINVLAFAMPVYGIVFAWRSRLSLLGVEP
jgi:hypothetical protein